jgi:holo-[acyl-carrier protein] synthase
MEIGVDLVEIKRIRELIKNPRFLHKIFTDKEIEYCSKKKIADQHYAVRFACKEAVWKALNPSEYIKFKDMEILNENSGKPIVKFVNKKKNYGKKLKISLTHTKDYACAVAIFKK